LAAAESLAHRQGPVRAIRLGDAVFLGHESFVPGSEVVRIPLGGRGPHRTLRLAEDLSSALAARLAANDPESAHALLRGAFEGAPRPEPLADLLAGREADRALDALVRETAERARAPLGVVEPAKLADLLAFALRATFERVARHPDFPRLSAEERWNLFQAEFPFVWSRAPSARAKERGAFPTRSERKWDRVYPFVLGGEEGEAFRRDLKAWFLRYPERLDLYR
jgi:hypothetical protein